MRLLLMAALLAAPALAAPRDEPIPLRKGLPSEKGLGQMVVLTNLPVRDDRLLALKPLLEHRDAKVVRFKEDKVGSARTALRRAGPEFVALAVDPATVDVNFHYEVLELCRDLDDDPMPDFHFGYLCARDGADMARLVAGTLKRDADGHADPVAKTVSLDGAGEYLQELDFVLHFGHGQPWRVDGGLTGEQVGALDLPRAPVVWSGACFNGVLGRSYHKCAYQLVFLRPTTIDPAHLMTLNWVKAGASAYFAAMEGDRGEMAIAEWEHFRARACPLGEAIGHQYRLAFTSLPAEFEAFPRYVPGAKKRMAFYDVMLRGMVSRILLGDPAARPLRKPLDDEPQQATAVLDPDAKTLTVTVEAKRWAQGFHLNYLPESRKGVFDTRLTARVEVPGDFDPAAVPEVSVRRGAELPELTRWHVRHEVWGGKRYVNVQAEMPPGSVGEGARATFVFPVR